MIALIDVNNFYVSCQRANPETFTSIFFAMKLLLSDIGSRTATTHADITPSFVISSADF